MSHTKNIVYSKSYINSFIFGGFAHHCNENCLSILNTYSKSKCDLFSSNGIVFKSAFGQFSTDFLKQNPTTVARTTIIFVSFIEFPRQTKQGRISHRVFFLGGGSILTTFFMTVHEKNSKSGQVRYDLVLGDCLGKI
jgi:hypothetical protein